MEKPRQIAFQVLLEHSQGTEYLETLLTEPLRNNALSPADRGLLHELTTGVVRFQRALDWIIDTQTEGRPQQHIVRVLLRLGLYQLLWLDRIPSHAAVHETVELAKKQGLGPVAGFINAFLRKISQALTPWRDKLEALNNSQPAIRQSHPDWLHQRWLQQWSPQQVQSLMEWNNRPPSVFARANLLKTSTQDLESLWTREGVHFSPRSYPWSHSLPLYELHHHPSLTSLASFQAGGFYLQDPSTTAAVLHLNPQPGETILDMCAAPGGKSTLIAQLMKNQGRILAMDSHRSRLQLIKENCQRLGVSIIQTTIATTVKHPELSVSFDRILLDAPCSNTGVMRRRVDVRWRLKPEEIQRLKNSQSNLLDDAAPQLRVGGRLVYSTCSLEPEENHQVAHAFLRHHPEFKMVTEQQLTPMTDGVDGAYVAVLEKSEI